MQNTNVDKVLNYWIRESFGKHEIWLHLLRFVVFFPAVPMLIMWWRWQRRWYWWFFRFSTSLFRCQFSNIFHASWSRLCIILSTLGPFVSVSLLLDMLLLAGTQYKYTSIYANIFVFNILYLYLYWSRKYIKPKCVQQPLSIAMFCSSKLVQKYII